jgi:hypothetical protein
MTRNLAQPPDAETSPARTTPEPTPQVARARRKRSWLKPQFGLRTLLVLTLLIGVAGGLFSRYIMRANRQREVVAQLAAAGFVLEYDHGANTGYFGTLLRADASFWQQPDFFHHVTHVASMVDISYSSPSLELISQLPDVEVITISFSNEDDYTLPSLPQLACRRTLNRLRISHLPLRERDLQKIGECTRLTSLEISVAPRSSRELAQIDHLPNLQLLYIDGPITEDAVAKWKHLTRIKTLLLPNIVDVSGATLTALVQRNPQLTRVELRGATCTVELCEALAQCQSLQELSLSDTQVNDEALSKLQTLPNLVTLHITRSPVRGTAFAGAQSFPQLNKLVANGSQIDDEGLACVSKLPRLKTLDLSHTPITDAGCEQLSGCPVTNLDLSYTGVTDDGIGALRCGNLTYLTLSHTKVSPQAFLTPSQWPNLHSLHLGTVRRNSAELKLLHPITRLMTVFTDSGDRTELHMRTPNGFKFTSYVK